MSDDSETTAHGEPLPPDLTEDELTRRNLSAIRLVRSWMDEDPAYDRATLPQLRRAIDDNRAMLGARKLFG